MLPILSYQKLLSHVDGSSPAPPATVTTGDKATNNPAYVAWVDADQRAIILLHSSLSEEAAAEVLGLSTAAQIWTALQNAYSSFSVERVQSLRDTLRQLTEGPSTVTDFGRKFKALCDQLSVIGHTVEDMDKTHWFLCGLGPSFVTFPTDIRATKPAPVFRDLLAQAESHKMFLRSLHGTVTPQISFVAQQVSSPSRGSSGSRGRHGGSSRGNSGGNSAAGRGRGRRAPHCQLCRTNGHYASSCPNLATYAQHAVSPEANLAQAFHAQCHVTSNAPDWFVDSGATTHMTSSPDTISSASPYTGSTNVVFGNGKTLPISHTGSSNETCTCSGKM